MPGNSRLNDIWSGICCCHSKPPCVGMSGPIITASPDVLINNLGAARLGDIVIGFCGHSGVIVTASPDVLINNLGAARLGDSVTGCTIGTIVTSSTDTITDP